MNAVTELPEAGSWHGPAALAMAPKYAGYLAVALNPQRAAALVQLLAFAREVATDPQLGPGVLARVVEAAEERSA